jgi:hypothetical protein
MAGKGSDDEGRLTGVRITSSKTFREATKAEWIVHRPFIKE